VERYNIIPCIIVFNVIILQAAFFARIHFLLQQDQCRIEVVLVVVAYANMCKYKCLELLVS